MIHEYKHRQDVEWLIEFFQTYEDGFDVSKRGLDATPIVIKKFNLVKNKVMAFTSYQYANKALTVFHFYPDFPKEDRRPYMRKHEEGHKLAVSMGSRRAAQCAQFRRVMEERISGWRRVVVVALQTALLNLLIGGSATR